MLRHRLKPSSLIDPDAASMADLSKAQVADDGKVTGVKEALEVLLTAKPYLKGQGSNSAGGGTNPPLNKRHLLTNGCS